MGKRRASGEGLLRWRKDRKCWEGRITVGTNEKGKPITKCFSGKTQRDVIAQMSQHREQLRGICLSGDSRMKLKDWGEKWLNEHMVHLIRPSTLKRYRRQCEIHIYPYLGDCQISKITTKQIQRMYNDLKENGRQINVNQKGKSLTGNTVRGIHTILHEMMEYALKENMIFNNPTNGTTIPKIEPFELQILTDKQIKKFMAAIQSDSDWRDFFYLEIMSGLRSGEICGLKWSDFDMVERKLNINRSISPEGVVGNTKTHYSVRSIKLPHSVYQILADRKETSRSDWIFPHPKDPTKPITGSIALRRLRKILSQADLPRIRFHDLRHTFATWASKLTNINKVEISHTFMEDVSWLNNLRKLRWLELHLSPIKDLSVLSDHKYIHILSLCDLEITDISFIEQYQRLKFLDVVGCPIKDYTPILRIPPLEQLIIDEDVVESLGMDALVKHHPDAEIEVRRKKNNNDLW